MYSLACVCALVMIIFLNNCNPFFREWDSGRMYGMTQVHMLESGKKAQSRVEG